MRCPECETFETLTFPVGDYYFWFPLDHSREKFAAVHPSTATSEGNPRKAVRLTKAAADMSRCVIELAGIFTPEELSAIKVLSMRAGHVPSFEDSGRVVTLERLIGAHHANWLVDMIQSERHTSVYQPIVSAVTGKVFAHEALFRGVAEDGSPIAPGFMFDLAARAGMLFQLDLAARRSAVNCAAGSSLTNRNLFINFNPSSIYDPAYCLRTTASTIAEAGLKPEQIIFEVVESEQIKSVAHLKGILSFYRSAGFKIALDDVGAGYSGLNLLQDLWPDFLKIDMHLIRDVDIDTFRQSIVRNIIAMAHENRIQVVAEGIETAAELNWLTRAGVDLIQGFHIAKPRSAAECAQAMAA
jgi:EAL domain-containing protein (putative c-di-GMP-specific phosphodiesterase class I)